MNDYQSSSMSHCLEDENMSSLEIDSNKEIILVKKTDKNWTISRSNFKRLTLTQCSLTLNTKYLHYKLLYLNEVSIYCSI